jgi:hypothetical protein
LSIRPNRLSRAEQCCSRSASCEYREQPQVNDLRSTSAFVLPQRALTRTPIANPSPGPSSAPHFGRSALRNRPQERPARHDRLLSRQRPSPVARWPRRNRINPLKTPRNNPSATGFNHVRELHFHRGNHQIGFGRAVLVDARKSGVLCGSRPPLKLASLVKSVQVVKCPSVFIS